MKLFVRQRNRWDKLRLKLVTVRHRKTFGQESQLVRTIHTQFANTTSQIPFIITTYVFF